MTLLAVTRLSEEISRADIVLDLSRDGNLLQFLCVTRDIIRAGVSYGHTVVWLTCKDAISWKDLLKNFRGRIILNLMDETSPSEWPDSFNPELYEELQEYEADDGRYLTEYERAKRSERLSELMKCLFNHRCMFCGFGIETDGRPYVETHHIHELGDGGSDTPRNIAVCCPNHHQEFHYGTDILRLNLKTSFSRLNPFAAKI